ncbi:MAG: carbonic anhydrase [Cyclobacteriaceae bacterium]|jgi:carbonic anhydrase
MTTSKHLNYLALLLASALGCTTKSTSTDTPANKPDSTQTTSARPVHWGYEGEDGPAGWATLSPVYALCGNGKSQSPINVVKTDAKGGATWQLDYKSTSLRIAHNEHMEDIIDNGHTIQVTVDEGSVFTFEGKSYNLKQFHFHTPSEHTIDGQHAPMEMHMVHQAEDGTLAVVGILFQEGTVPNPNFEKIIANLPNAKGESKHITDVNLELKVHLPADNYAYHYVGSLTTPPCSEGVQWLVLRDPVRLIKDQIEAFASRIGPNNRPTQSLNDRVVKVDDLVGNVQP